MHRYMHTCMHACIHTYVHTQTKSVSRVLNGIHEDLDFAAERVGYTCKKPCVCQKRLSIRYTQLTKRMKMTPIRYRQFL